MILLLKRNSLKIPWTVMRGLGNPLRCLLCHGEFSDTSVTWKHCWLGLWMMFLVPWTIRIQSVNKKFAKKWNLASNLVCGFEFFFNLHENKRDYFVGFSTTSRLHCYLCIPQIPSVRRMLLTASTLPHLGPTWQLPFMNYNCCSLSVASCLSLDCNLFVVRDCRLLLRTSI